MQRNERKGCGYYRWHDPPVEGRLKNIIPGLLRKIEKLEDEIKELKRKEQKDAMWLRVVTGVLVLILGLALGVYFTSLYLGMYTELQHGNVGIL